MHVKESSEKVKFWRLPRMNNLELLHARYQNQTFNKHYHEGYAVGVIEEGALGFHYLGRDVVAGAGDINLAVPGETHNGFAVSDQGWRYRMFYMDADLLERASSEIGDRKQGLPFFKTGVISDPWLYRQIRGLHRALVDPNRSLLEKESRFLWTMSQFILRHADNAPRPVKTGSEKGAAARVQDYIQDCYMDPVSLEELSRIAGLSRFHLLRVFQKETGLPPHAFQNVIRMHQAKNLLASGRSIADVAFSTGFFDQSHLTRQFKRTFGVTPGHYRKNVQDNPS